ncbi:Endonuclease/exonuclease/phosphatase [Cinara cedri]|uniref:Endonuclease/exonuclease/phosphatase n=1 Tax=Cinara cedri TaxID=506608 RepID=A0A5E4NPD7_9HEMI|nr:Endonuclease/exonuclease/phosphatase [Cinara cedri]
MASFIQWNINDFYKRSVGINCIIYDLQPAILCFQETNLKNNHCANIKNYTGYFKNRTLAFRASGGVATFIKDTIDSENISITSDLEVIATLVKFHKPLSICNIYIPDSKTFTKQHLKDITKQLPKPFVLLGDFNSRNTSWGCTHTDLRGQIVEQFLEDESLILPNNNQPIRHNVSNGNFSAIDLTITNTNFSTLFDWQVLSAYSDSDHWPIGIQYQNHLSLNKFSTKWNFKKPNWDLFSENIEYELTQNSLIDLNPNCNQLKIASIVKKSTDIILEAANLSIGFNTHQNIKKTVPWWNK